MDKVIENLYIGGISGACDYKLLKSNGITRIVSAQPATIYDDITYHNVHVDDDERADIYSYFYDAVQFIDDAICENGNVFVHCYAGISRSASIVLAYLMAIKKYTLESALELLISKRKICDPNSGFILQLKCFEWALSLMPKSYITNQIITGPVFNGIQFDFANYDVLFTEDLEALYDDCIFIDRCYMPKFRPVITGNIDYNYIKDYCDKIYQIDILEKLPNPTAVKRVLITSTNDTILVLAYWNLLYRNGMTYDAAFKYFKQNTSVEFNNAFTCNAKTILYPFITPRDKIIETQLARLNKLEEDSDKKFMSGNLKYRVTSIKVFIECVCHYFIPEIQECKKELCAKLDRQMSMTV